MTVAQIRVYPDEVLRAKCRPVGIDDRAAMEDVRQLVLALNHTMQKHEGWGLAAPQIGEQLRVFVVHVPTETRLPIVFVNPRLLAAEFPLVELREGCLSFPGRSDPVSRPDHVTVHRWDEFGRVDTHTFGGWTARAIQHELDHLDGKLLIDYLLPAARRKLERIMERKAIKHGTADLQAARRRHTRAELRGSAEIEVAPTAQVKPAVSQNAEESTLSASKVANLATILADGISAARNSVSLLTTFCAAAQTAGLPAAPTRAQVRALLDGVSYVLGWKGTAREKHCRKGARLIITQHARLPEAIKAYRATTGSCDYHQTLKLARAIRNKGNVRDAVAFLTEQRKAQQTDPICSMQRALKCFYNAMRDGAHKDRALNMAAASAFARAIRVDIGINGDVYQLLQDAA